MSLMVYRGYTISVVAKSVHGKWNGTFVWARNGASHRGEMTVSGAIPGDRFREMLQAEAMRHVDAESAASAAATARGNSLHPLPQHGGGATPAGPGDAFK